MPDPGSAQGGPLPGLTQAVVPGLKGFSVPAATDAVGVIGSTGTGATAATGARLGSLACGPASVVHAASSTSLLRRSIDHDGPYSSSMTAFHKALSWDGVNDAPSLAASGRLPGPLRHCCHAFHRIGGGRYTTPSRIASNRFSSLPLTCMISGNQSINNV